MLSASSRAQLTTWMVANKTGDTRLRAGLPGDWRIGDKTGSGDHAATNDIAVIWPPGRGPIVVDSLLRGVAGAERGSQRGSRRSRRLVAR